MEKTINQVYDKKFKERDHEFSFDDVVRGMLYDHRATSTNLDGSVTEYGVDNAALMYSDATEGYPLLDQATRALLYQHFKTRKICTNDQETIVTYFDEFGIPDSEYENVDFGKFMRLYNETLINCQPMYEELLRLERTKIDPMVSDYLEYWYKDSSSKEGTGHVNSEKTPELINKQTTVTNDLHGTESSTNNDSTTYGKKIDTNVNHAVNATDTRTLNLSDSGTSSEHSVNADTNLRTYNNYSETDDSKQASMAKNLPNSISYQGVSAGSLPGLNWGTASAQNQTETDNTHTINGSIEDSHTFSNAGTTSASHTGTDTMDRSSDNTVSGTLAEESGVDLFAKSGNKTTANTGTVVTSEDNTAVSGSSSSNSSNTETTEFEHKEVKTGRSGLPPQEALKSASAWIKQSRAFNWLTKELDSCFMQIL